ncbi:tetratricopeptide repeat protein [Shewanella sp. MBTL60-007]|uniref:tetratricopeptide repeat protein n=1 Tax=Shewanella sp. MBTL60-007 TaxID=2815911 RepID=UPI001BBFA0FF|nr:tetratricopeptide repeat protein [Shewanella sp. MBTL60-007]GIU32543.1 hypothetical protein TUM3792_45110 [Shewanella sp. MBTL60-007]
MLRLLLIFTLMLPFMTLANSLKDNNFRSDYGKAIDLYNQGEWDKPETFLPAFNIFKVLAEKGHYQSQVQLTLFYSSGLGVQVDKQKSFYWALKVAEQGKFMDIVAADYYEGSGVEQSYEKAMYWYLKDIATSPPHTSTGSRNMVALMYYKGQGVKQNYQKALQEFNKSSDLGHPTAKYFLALMYYHGHGVKQNFKEAADRLIAFDSIELEYKGHKLFLLASMYENGQGVDKDLSKALSLYQKSTLYPIDSKTDKSKSKVKQVYLELCLPEAHTLLFGVKIKCAYRDTMQPAVKRAGSVVKVEGEQYWSDTYETSKVLKDSKSLSISYTLEGNFAKAKYVFPSNLDADQVIRIRGFIARKYGSQDSIKGNAKLGEVTYKWTLDDGIRIIVYRGWPDTTTYLSFESPKHLAIYDKQREQQRKARERREYKEQSNAF